MFELEGGHLLCKKRRHDISFGITKDNEQNTCTWVGKLWFFTTNLVWKFFTTIHNPRFAYTKHLTLATKLAFVFTFWAEHCAKIRTLHDSNDFFHQLNSRPWNKTCNEDVDTPKKPLYSHHPGLKFNLYHQGQACKHILSQLHSHSTQLFQQTCVVPHDLTVAISGGK